MYEEKIHYFEKAEERRVRLNSKGVHGQSLCGNGSVRQRSTRTVSLVECEACLNKLKELNKI